MRHLATTMSIIGTILVSAGAICFFIANAASAGIYALYALGGIALAIGMISFVVHFFAEKDRPRIEHR